MCMHVFVVDSSDGPAKASHNNNNNNWDARGISLLVSRSVGMGMGVGVGRKALVGVFLLTKLRYVPVDSLVINGSITRTRLGERKSHFPTITSLFLLLLARYSSFNKDIYVYRHQFHIGIF